MRRVCRRSILHARWNAAEKAWAEIGEGLPKGETIHGFAAETGAAAVLLTTAHFGLPVSTTHTITSSVMGVGAVQRLSAVRWGVSARIFSAWIFTLPGSGLAASLLYLLLSLIG